MDSKLTRYCKILNVFEDYVRFGYRQEREEIIALSLKADVTMDSIYEQVSRCTKCNLHSSRNQTVPGCGVINAKLMLIGEGPGAEEDRQGLPFVGKAGQYLDKWMAAIDLYREKDLYITNIVKCRPPDNRDPLEPEVEACVPYLKQQITLISPPAILALGRVAARILLNISDTMSNLRQEKHEYEGIPLICTYHPSAVLRNPNLRKPVWEDLQKVKNLIDKP